MLASEFDIHLLLVMPEYYSDREPKAILMDLELQFKLCRIQGSLYV